MCNKHCLDCQFIFVLFSHVINKVSLLCINEALSFTDMFMLADSMASAAFTL